MKTTRETLKNGAVVYLSRKVSDHPDDNGLTIVLCRHNNEWVTWTRNKKDAGEDGLFYGHYHGDDIRKAACDFGKR